MDVAAQHDRVGRLRRHQGVEQTVASSGVAVPAVGPELLARAGLFVDVRHHRALGEQRPLCLAGGEFRGEPLLLPRTKLAARRVEQLRAVRDAIRTPSAWSRARLGGAVLTLVKHQQVYESTEHLRAVQTQVRPERYGASRQRHVLVIGFVGGGAAREKQRRVVVLLGCVVRVIVVHLVVVPGDHPRT
jgi:hypothetical protein